MSATASNTELAAWIGRSQTAHDTITAAPVQALAATLDHPAAPLPRVRSPRSLPAATRIPSAVHEAEQDRSNPAR